MYSDDSIADPILFGRPPGRPTTTVSLHEIGDPPPSLLANQTAATIVTRSINRARPVAYSIGGCARSISETNAKYPFAFLNIDTAMDPENRRRLHQQLDEFTSPGVVRKGKRRPSLPFSLEYLRSQTLMPAEHPAPNVP